MTTLFHDMMHKKLEVYVDDMIAKSLDAETHLRDLRKLFDRLRKYQASILLSVYLASHPANYSVFLSIRKESK